jgi:hypothetical protein
MIDFDVCESGYMVVVGRCCICSSRSRANVSHHTDELNRGNNMLLALYSLVHGQIGACAPILSFDRSEAAPHLLEY